MDAEIILAIVAPMILLSSLIGTIGYRKILGKFEGIMSTGTAILFAIGIAALIMCIGSISRMFRGNANVLELIMCIVIAGFCGYIFSKALSRCTTTKEKVMLPFACWCVAMGFGFRVVLKIFMNLPMDGSSSGGFPKHFHRNGKFYSLVADYGTSAEYQSEDGDRITLNRSQADSIPDSDIRNDID